MENSSNQIPKITFGLREAVDVSSLVTKSDKSGYITFANDNFCKISGFTQEELIGQPHNIIRHPDMPSSSFEDMWATIKAKKIWNGIIQNRHKNGGSYFVSATVTPSLDENNEIIEYISIRRDITELHLLKDSLEERVAEEVEKNKKKDKDLINNLSLFLDSTPNAIIVLDTDKNIKFANKSFLKLVGKKKESMLNNKYDFSSLLVKGGGYISKEEDLIPNHNNKIAITTNHGRNIFQLFYKEIQDSNNDSFKMYTLNNITKNEYQKIKINHYNAQLQEYYMRNKAKSSQNAPYRGPAVVTVKEEVKSEIIKQTRELNDAEKKLLKRKHGDVAVSSVEYSHDLDEYILTEIQELDEIENEIQNLIHEVQDKKLDSMHNIVLHLLKFSSVLNNLMEFKELSFSISSLADLLDKQNLSTMDETTCKKMLLFLENITLDLSSWRKIVFIEQSANDIHYMDSSLFSSILQLELIFNTDQQHEEDDDDFELF